MAFARDLIAAASGADVVEESSFLARFLLAAGAFAGSFVLYSNKGARKPQ